jgi:hypothetical protein
MDVLHQQVIDTLTRAAVLVGQPGTWTQAAYARDLAQRPVADAHQAAVRWCVAGAVRRCAGEVEPPLPFVDVRVRERAIDALRATLQLTPKQSIAEWNDTPGRTQDDVVAALMQTVTRLLAS